ncbi:transcription termination/antitermination protein NusG, partial [Mycobacterium helveticum]
MSTFDGDTSAGEAVDVEEREERAGEPQALEAPDAADAPD